MIDDVISRLGRALGDRYRVDRVLGSGGMATVVLAHDLRHDARVAIKVLRPELAAVMGGARFAREVRITAGLQHPNILPVLDSGEAEGLAFYVMAYVEGESLAQRLQRETRLPLDEAVQLVAEVADGLAHAHAAGYVHRDIKPANILLSHGHAVIADFGIARALEVTGADRLTESGLAIGTPTYMSPEQAGADRIDGRSDIYSLAVVLYEALTGAPPFTGVSGQAILARSAVDPVPSIRTVRQSVPQALEAVINKGLAKVPEDRFPDAAAFRDALRQAVTMPVTAELPPSGRRARRLRRLAAVVTGGLAVVAAGVALWVATAGPTVDPHRVMVYPLLVPDDWPGARTTGEDVATVIGSAMDGAGELRWVDGWQLLQPAQRENIRLLSAKDARAIARNARCAYVVSGRLVVAQGDSADVYLELYDVAGDSVIARPTGKGAPIGESWRGGMRAITEILPKLIPTVVPDLAAEWIARPPQAVAHFLLGEAAFRRVELPQAVAEFGKAVAEDSSFSLAAVRGAQAATWNHEPAAAAALIRAASRGKLSPRYTFFAGGFQAYLDGRADSAAALFGRALAIDSTMAVAWIQLGEIYMHLLPAEGRTDSLAERAFLQARALDSTAVNLLYHLIEIAVRQGDPDRAAALADRFARLAGDTLLVREVELLSACEQDGFGALDLRRAAAERPLPLLFAAKALSAPATAGCALAGFAAILQVDTARTDSAGSRRFFSMLGQLNLLSARGRTAEAMAALDGFRQRWGSGSSLNLLAAAVLPEFADRARAVAGQNEVDFGPSYAGVGAPTVLWEMGVWAARDGRAPTARAAATELARRASAGTRLDSLLARSMAAHLMLAEGDSLLALERFASLVAQAASTDETLSWDEAGGLGLDRLILGRLLIWHREYARAIRVLEVHDSAAPSVFPLYLKASLSLRADAATALGRTEIAATLLQRVAALSGK
ncbi:MAG: protein kinase domain-containing protein [Gemmatimonadales bacterium]